MTEKGLYDIIKKRLKMQQRKKSTCAYKCSFNIAVLGSAAVGKTSLLNRITKHCFTERHLPTKLDVQEFVVQGDSVEVTLRMHDISNREEFSLTRRQAIFEADGFILVFSLADKMSFEELDILRLRIEAAKGRDISNLPVVIVGNKSDLRGVEVSHDQILRLCMNEMDSLYIECSAKNGSEVSRICPALYDELGVCGSIYEKVLSVQCREEVGKVKKRFGSG